MTVCNACRYCEQVLSRVPGDGGAPDVREGGPRLPGEPLSQLRRVSLRLPVRAAARVRHQRAEDARRDPAAVVSGIRVAARARRRVHSAQPADRPRSGGGPQRNHGCRGAWRLVAGRWLGRLLRRRPARRHGEPVRRSSFSSRSIAMAVGVTRFVRDVRGQTRGQSSGSEPQSSTAHASAPPRERRRLRVGRRTALAVATMAAPLHVLRLPPVLRLDVGRGAL